MINEEKLASSKEKSYRTIQSEIFEEEEEVPLDTTVIEMDQPADELSRIYLNSMPPLPN